MFQKCLSEINRDKSAPQKRKVRKRSSHGKSLDETGGRNRPCYGFSNKSVFWTRGLISGGFCFLLIYETVFISCLPKAKRARESSAFDDVKATNKLFLRFDQKLVNCGYTMKSYCQPVINAFLNTSTPVTTSFNKLQICILDLNSRQSSINKRVVSATWLTDKASQWLE